MCVYVRIVPSFMPAPLCVLRTCVRGVCALDCPLFGQCSLFLYLLEDALSTHSHRPTSSQWEDCVCVCVTLVNAIKDVPIRLSSAHEIILFHHITPTLLVSTLHVRLLCHSWMLMALGQGV